MSVDSDPVSKPCLIISLGVEGGGARVFGRQLEGVWSYWTEGSSIQDIDAGEEWKCWTTTPVANLIDALPNGWIQMFPNDIERSFRAWFRERYEVELFKLSDEEMEIHQRRLCGRWSEVLQPGTQIAASETAAKGFWLLLRFNVAGFRFHTGMALSEMMRPGDTLSLVAEPENEHDPRAVRLDFGDMHVGYVPREHNTIIATLLAQGAPLECKIVAIRLDADPWEMIEAEIRLLRERR